MQKIIIPALVLVILATGLGRAGLNIKIDAEKDSFYTRLSGPGDGYVLISRSSFLPFCGAKPESDADLSAQIWTAWDESYFYLYAEIRDDVIRVNNDARPQNDCLELKFDPDPLKKLNTGIINARLTALDSANAENLYGVDNLYSEEYLNSSAITRKNYSRKITADGYVIELSLAWEWLSTDTKKIEVTEGSKFGFAINIHDNDSDKRDGSIQWSAGRADEVWTMPQLLGTAELGPNHTLRLIKENSIDPGARPATVYISAEHLNKNPKRHLRVENWRFYNGDDLQYARPDFDDSDWEINSSIMTSLNVPGTGWHNIGWFRAEFKVDSSILAKPLSFIMFQSGASEIYLDGQLLYELGKVSDIPENEISYWEQNPRVISFKNPGRHQLAVRYSNTSSKEIMERNGNAGFSVSISNDLLNVIDTRVQQVREISVFQVTFVVIPALLAILHFFLFIFYRSARENLFFTLCMLFWTIITFTDFHGPFYTSLRDIYLFSVIGSFAIVPALISGLLTIYITTYVKIPRKFWIFLGIGVITLILQLIFSVANRPLGIFLYLLIGAVALEILRLLVYQGLIKRQMRRLILIGFGFFMLAIMYQILSNLQILPRVGEYGIAYVYGLLVLSIFVSVDLSLNFARTNRNLERRLLEIQELSDKTLRQERHMREEAIRRRLLEADNARKTQELDEARNLQLSMLPREIPMPANLEIAAKMITANEVGGDYYDFSLGDDSTFTVAIGDATGHGMRAGTMVASVKSLFAAFGDQPDIGKFFNRCTDILKEMHMGNIFMGMMLVRFNCRSMSAAAAGMPPIFIHRKMTGKVEEMVMKGMPLGASRNFKYQQKETTIEPGDTILLITDGFPELFNKNKEMIDYQRLKERLAQVADRSAQQIIDDLVQMGQEWQQDEPQADDCTFVVLKVKDNSA